MEAVSVVLAAVGLGTVGLGLIHLVIPRLIDVERAIPDPVPPLRPLPIVGSRYRTRRQDVLGVIWVSNNAASWVLLTLGVADLLAGRWLGSDPGRLLALWAVGWWLVRAGSQLAFGHRTGDWLLAGVFLGAAGAHAWAVMV